MNNDTRDVVMRMAEKLHVCLVKTINTALTDRIGADWFVKFKDFDSKETKPVLDKNHISVSRMDLQACLKFFRYRCDYAKIVFEYYGHNFYMESEDARQAQWLLNQRLDNLIHNMRNHLYAHASAVMVESGNDNSLRCSVYGAKEAIDDMLKLANFFSDVTDEEGVSYYAVMCDMARPSSSFPIADVIAREKISINVGAFAEICNKLGLRVGTSKDGNMSFMSENYDGDIAKIKLYINQHINQSNRYNVAEVVAREKIKADTGTVVVVCQDLNIPVTTDPEGGLAFSSSNYGGDVARIKLALNSKQAKSNKKVLVIVIVAIVLLTAGITALVLGLGKSDNADKGGVTATVETTEDLGYNEDEVTPEEEDWWIEEEDGEINQGDSEALLNDLLIRGEGVYDNLSFTIDQHHDDQIELWINNDSFDFYCLGWPRIPGEIFLETISGERQKVSFEFFEIGPDCSVTLYLEYEYIDQLIDSISIKGLHKLDSDGLPVNNMESDEIIIDIYYE